MTSGSRSSPRIWTTPAASSPSSTSACSSTSATGERAQPAREHRAHRAIGLAERDQEALAGVAVALGLERARREARRDPDLGIVVAREPAQHRQHLERAELGEVAHRRDLDLGLEIAARAPSSAASRAGRRADLGQRGRARPRPRSDRRARAARADRPRSIAPIRPSAAIAARRSARGRAVADERGDRLLERREAEPAGGVERGRGDRRIAIRRAGGARTAAARCCGTRGPSRAITPRRSAAVSATPRRLEQRERRALGDAPTRRRARVPRDRRAAGTRRAARCASAPRAPPPRACAHDLRRRAPRRARAASQRTCGVSSPMPSTVHSAAVAERFTVSDHATDADIDELGHVSNLVYLRWVLEVATAHSARRGWGHPEYRALGACSSCAATRSTTSRQVMLGEEVDRRDLGRRAGRRASCIRETELTRGDQVVARAATTWAFISLASGRPAAHPRELLAAFCAEISSTVRRLHTTAWRSLVASIEVHADGPSRGRSCFQHVPSDPTVAPAARQVGDGGTRCIVSWDRFSRRIDRRADAVRARAPASNGCVNQVTTGARRRPPQPRPGLHERLPQPRLHAGGHRV